MLLRLSWIGRVVRRTPSRRFTQLHKRESSSHSDESRDTSTGTMSEVRPSILQQIQRKLQEAGEAFDQLGVDLKEKLKTASPASAIDQLLKSSGIPCAFPIFRRSLIILRREIHCY